MKRKIYFTLSDFVNKLSEEEYINVYDENGFTMNIKVSKIPEEYLKKEVIKYKVDRAIPNLHFKIIKESA